MLKVIFGQVRVPQQSNQVPHQNKKSTDKNPFETTTTKSEAEKNDRKINDFWEGERAIHQLDESS